MPRIETLRIVIMAFLLVLGPIWPLRAVYALPTHKQTAPVSRSAGPSFGQMQSALLNSSDCQGWTANVHNPSDTLESKGKNASDPCTGHAGVEGAEEVQELCKEAMEEMEKSFGEWLTAHKENCALIEKGKKQICGSPAECQVTKVKFDQEAQAAKSKEKIALDQAIGKVKEVEKALANGVDHQAKVAQQAAAGKAAAAGGVGVGRLPAQEVGYRFDSNKGNNLSGAAEQIRSGRGINESTISGVGDLGKETLDLAQVAQQFRQELEARKGELDRTGAELGRQTGVADGNRNNLGSLMASNAPSIAQAAQAMGGAGGAPAGSSPSTGGGSGGGSLPMKSSTLSYGDPEKKEDALKGDPTIPKPKVSLTGTTPLAGSAPEGAKSPKLSSLDLSKSPDTKAPGQSANSPQASGGRSSSSGLREALRARLLASQDSSGGGGADGSGSKGKNDFSGAPGMAKTDFPQLPPALDIDPASLGDPSFSLAGSETDAFVQNMVKGLGGEDLSGRRLASAESENIAVYGELEVTLFYRQHTKLRLMQKGGAVQYVPKSRI